MLFEEGERVDDAPARQGEGAHSFLDRSRRAAQVRDLLNRWASAYPSPHSTELAIRMRTGGDEGWRSGFLELYTYQVFSRLGCEIVVHPTVPGSSRHPDFLIVRESESFYVECIAVDGATRDERVETRRLDEFVDYLQSLQSDDFLLGLEIDGAAQSAIPARRFRNQIEEWLNSMSPEVVGRIELGGIAALPKLLLEHDGLRLYVHPISRNADRSKRVNVRPVAVQMDARPRVVVPNLTLARAIKQKASRYGSLDRPYVLVASSSSPFMDGEFVAETLLGTLQLKLVAKRTGGTDIYPTRADDGSWWRFSTQSPRNTTMSGLLLIHHLNEWSIARSDPELHLHPQPRHVLSIDWMPFTAIRYGEQVERTPGATGGMLLGLGVDWPE